MVFATDVGSLNWLKTIKIFYVLHKCDYLWGPRLHNHSNLVFHVSRGPLRWKMMTLDQQQQQQYLFAIRMFNMIYPLKRSFGSSWSIWTFHSSIQTALEYFYNAFIISTTFEMYLDAMKMSPWIWIITLYTFRGHLHSIMMPSTPERA